MPASIMRLTALPPPPPMPITFMRAPVMGGSSSMKILMPLSGYARPRVIVISSLPKREGFQGLFLSMLGCSRHRHRYIADYILCDRGDSIQQLVKKYY